MTQLIKYLWQLPQNLLGLLVILLSKAKLRGSLYIANNLFNSGVSLGKYIIFQKDCYTAQDIKHEKGHQIQSLKYGCFYLLVVGLPSIARNVWDRLAHKKWDYFKRSKWYYGGFPEKQADELGGVVR